MDFLAEDYLMHHGIKGMKWGVRRYQNPDGSLTPAGEKRYGTIDNFNKANKHSGDSASNAAEKKSDDPVTKTSSVTNKKIKDINRAESKLGKEIAGRIRVNKELVAIAGTAAVVAGASYIASRHFGKEASAYMNTYKQFNDAAKKVEARTIDLMSKAHSGTNPINGRKFNSWPEQGTFMSQLNDRSIKAQSELYEPAWTALSKGKELLEKRDSLRSLAKVTGVGAAGYGALALANTHKKNKAQNKRDTLIKQREEEIRKEEERRKNKKQKP